MNVGVISHCTIDSITVENSQVDVPGGPACYCAFTAKNLKFDVDLFTKYGSDFPLQQKLLELKISTHNSLSEQKTTRFKIDINGSERRLFLQEKCQPIDFIDGKNDGLVISPVFDEISLDTYSQIKDSGNFVFLDPQGFLREKNENNQISLKKTDLNLSNINAIKMNPDELFALTGLTRNDGIKQLQKLGIEYVIYTNKQEISLLVKDKLYSIKLPKMTLTDTTGIGDIFCATFVCTMLKEKDFLWALSFAGGAAQAALESKAFGLEKIPEKNALETNGSYFYNMVEFEQI